MPVADGKVLRSDGKGGFIEEPTVITRIQIGSPQLGECVVIKDDEGIIIEKDPITGMPIVHAEHMTVTSERKTTPNFPKLLERLFPRKEK